MKIGIVGAGISGMTAAYYLARRHQVTVLEANDYLGGHTHTHEVSVPADSTGRTQWAIDTGFIVFNDRTYPNFQRLLGELRVPFQPTQMTFSVSCERTGLEYRGADWDGFFAQRRNVWRPSFYLLLREMWRFNRSVEKLLASEPPAISVGDFFAKHRFSASFREQFFLPMASAIWSCPHSLVAGFPMAFIVEFYRHHGLLSLRDRPQWYVITGGSQQYMRALVAATPATYLPQTPVARLVRHEHGVTLHPRSGPPLEFDHVILACHSDQALQILGSAATSLEQDVLGAFPYERNLAILHTDRRLLPRNRRAWACWNYHLPRGEAWEQSSAGTAKATVTYYMNQLQGLSAPVDFCVSLNCEERIDPATVLRRVEYHHPVFTTRRQWAQAQHAALLGPQRTSFAGAYWGNGFHEDGVVSALKVCQALDRESCEVVSTKGGLSTTARNLSNTGSARGSE